MRIIYIGAVVFSKAMLEKLIDLKADIVGVVTQKSQKFNTDFADLAPICTVNNIPHRYVADINDAGNRDWIKGKHPDMIFCFGFSQIIKKDILNLAPMGVVGFHPALLPRNRGRHPLIWALALGLRKTASTFFFMDEGADSGDILSQEEVEIAQEDNAATLYQKIITVAVRQLDSFFPCLLKGSCERKPQDTLKATYWRKRQASDGKIDFRMCKKAIYNLVRALTRPYAGAHVVYKGSEIKIWEIKESEAGSENDECGKVLGLSGSGILVKCYDGAVLLIRHEFNTLPKKGEYIL